MTFEQFLGGVLGLALIAIARLVDRWLPPTESASPSAGSVRPPERPAAPAGGAAPPETPRTSGTLQVPSSDDLDIIDDPGDTGPGG